MDNNDRAEFDDGAGIFETHPAVGVLHLSFIFVHLCHGINTLSNYH